MQKVKLNIVPKGVKKTAYLSQNDNGRVVRYELFNELVPYTLDGSETITVTVVRPDGEEIVSSVPNTEEAYIDVTFNDDMSAIAGVGAGKIKITDGETELGSHNFDINVEIDAYNGKDVVIETETGTLLSFNTEIEDNALEYESEIPYNAEGYTGLEIINSRTAPAYDKTPYLFRKTPSGYGNSCIEKLNGLTVAFNQLIAVFSSDLSKTQNGVTITDNRDGTYTVQTDANGATADTFLAMGAFGAVLNHKYYQYGCPVGGSNSTYYLYSNGLMGTTREYGNGLIGNQQETRNVTPVIYIKQGAIITTPIVFKPQVIDLTQMFGSTIADYLYTLETQTAGAGVALFKSLGFDKPYYPYNAGELISVKTSGRKTVGFNQWDEEWELGGIDSNNGTNISQNTTIRSKNYITILPETDYYNYFGDISGGNNMQARFYDANKNYIGYTNYEGAPFNKNTVFKTPAGACFMRFQVQNGYGTTYKNDICINISDPDKNGTYEPYSEETYNLGGDELRGLLKLDSNNNIYADGDVKTSDGNIKRKFGIIEIGSITPVMYTVTEGNLFRFALDDLKLLSSDYDIANIVCVKYPTVASASRANKTISQVSALHRFDIIDNDYSDAASFKAAMSGQYLIYELATPTTESSTPFDNPQEVKITEEFIDERSIPIPVGHDTIYGTDIEYQDIDFDTTIFGGNINAVDGVLSSEYNSDGSVKPTPEIIDITPTPIPVRAGDNVIFNSAEGNQTIRYYNQVEE